MKKIENICSDDKEMVVRTRNEEMSKHQERKKRIFQVPSQGQAHASIYNRRVTKMKVQYRGQATFLFSTVIIYLFWIMSVKNSCL